MSPTPEPSLPGTRLALMVSALDADARSSLDPFGGRLALAVSLHNLSSEVLDVEVRFWAENAWGAKLGRARVVHVEQLASGEARTVSTELDRLGQGGLLRAFAEVTPPDTIDGQEQKPIRRDAWVVMTPWLGVVGCIAVGLGVGIPLLLRYWGLLPSGIWSWLRLPWR